MGAVWKRARAELRARVALGVVFGVAAGAAIGRRSRDLAILKTLGFVDRQVRRAVAVQPTLLTV